MSYETWDAIADSYIPILLVLFIAGLLFQFYKSRLDYRIIITHFGFLAGLLITSYGLMFFDNAVHLWPQFGMDYSTHTAVSLSLVLALCALFPRKWIILAISMAAYAGLMVHQEYHSVQDIVSTAVVIIISGVLIVGLNLKKYITF